MSDIPQKATQNWRKKEKLTILSRRGLQSGQQHLKTPFPQLKNGCGCNSEAMLWGDDKNWKGTKAVEQIKQTLIKH